MAVQAQYPSNILLLNRNAQQEGHDFSLQPQPGGLFHHQSSFNNVGGTNPRKRAREASITMPQMNFSSPQAQPPQLIDLSQLHRQQQANAVSTGLRLSFGEHQQQQINHNSSLLLSVLPTEDLASHMKQQRDEVDQFLHAQGEQLRRTLAEKRQRHYRALLRAAEESVVRRLREKETEMEKATRRNAELEARAVQLGVEAQLWRAKARANEATAASLQAQLHQAMLAAGPAVAHDDGAAVSCADAEDAESACAEPYAREGPGCHACRKRAASVVILPCRHLCVCTDCDRVVAACPVCRLTRNSSVEVFMS